MVQTGSLYILGCSSYQNNVSGTRIGTEFTFQWLGKSRALHFSDSTAGGVLSPTSKGQCTDNTRLTIAWRRASYGPMLPAPGFSKLNSSSA